jgi:hypothetical protein
MILRQVRWSEVVTFRAYITWVLKQEVTTSKSKFKYSGLLDEMKIEDHVDFLINLRLHWSKWFKIWFRIRILKIIFTPTSCHSFFIENGSDAELTSGCTVFLHSAASVKDNRGVANT